MSRGAADTELAGSSTEAKVCPIRVVHLLHTVAHGGIETILVNWLTRLDHTKVETRLVVFANPDQSERAFVDAAGAAGLTVEKIPWAARKPVFLASRRLVRLLRAWDADIVHTHNVYAEVVGYMAARYVGCKVMTTHYVWADFGWKRNIQQVISARLVRRFDLVTAQCGATMNEAVRRGVPLSRQRVLISGLEPCRSFLTSEKRAADRVHHGAGPGEVVLMNVARLYPEKGHAFLLKAFRRLVDERPHARLWILGVGPLEAELRRLTTELGLDQTVRFVGFIPSLREFMQLADVQVHPSFAEGVPLALCEGMAIGLPIVATAVGGVPEIIKSEHSGVLVPPRDEHAFVRHTIRLIDDAALRSRLGANARRFIENEYTVDVAVARLTATYEELVR